jgi:hypothetical protein
LIKQISYLKILPFNRPPTATSFLPLIITDCSSLSVLRKLVYAFFFSFKSCNLLSIVDHPIIYKKVDYIDNWTTVLGVYLVLISIVSRLIADWSVENMNLDVTQYVMSFDVSVSPKTKKMKIRKQIQWTSLIVSCH